jgi:hypothetical protein
MSDHDQAIEAAARAYKEGKHPGWSYDDVPSEVVKAKLREDAMAVVTAYRAADALSRDEAEREAHQLYDEHLPKNGECNCEFPTWCLFEAGSARGRADERMELGDAVRKVCNEWVSDNGIGPSSDWHVQRLLPLADRIDEALAHYERGAG